VRDRATFRGVATLYAYACLCGNRFKHAILNPACKRAPEANPANAAA
jgi:hypothetical protein